MVVNCNMGPAIYQSGPPLVGPSVLLRNYNIQEILIMYDCWLRRVPVVKCQPKSEKVRIITIYPYIDI